MSPLGGQYAALKAAEALEVTAQLEAVLHRAGGGAAPKGKKETRKLSKREKEAMRAAEREKKKVRKQQKPV